MTAGPVLVTGACGLVGTAVVRRLAGAGRRVVATDLDVPANRSTAQELARAGQVEVRWADLTDPDAVEALVGTVAPEAIVHLAAIIPPRCYEHRGLARRVNVDATASLVAAAEAMASPPRVVMASSVAVYGARNPTRRTDLLTASTPVDPCDLYGGHKVAAERVVTSSSLDWVILRLGGVLTPEPQFGADQDMAYFGALLPTDGRLQTVDVRDVAVAFDHALSTDAIREVFLIGGDESHRVIQGELGDAIAAAMGLGGGMLAGLPGDPDSDTDWFATDWMDTGRSQEVLRFQHHSLPDLFAETRAAVGWRRWPLRVAGPLLRLVMRSKAPYRDQPGGHADLWGAIERRFGDPGPDDAVTTRNGPSGEGP